MTQKTPLYHKHKALNAKMVDFCNWSLPLYYNSIIQENLMTRKRSTLFDVSHMGKIHVSGTDALKLLEKLSCNKIKNVEIGKVQYNVILNENGGIVDDITIYRLAEDAFFLVVNAINTQTVYQHIISYKQKWDLELNIQEQTQEWAQLALQGPYALELLNEGLNTDFTSLSYYCFTDLYFPDLFGDNTLFRISRTGYTGEDGFEIYTKPQRIIQLWDRLLETGNFKNTLNSNAPNNNNNNNNDNNNETYIYPAGLAARDSLRLEACFALYGNELNARRTPIESALNWLVKDKEESYLGHKTIQKQMKEGASKQIMFFVLLDTKAVSRSKNKVWDSNNQYLGEVLSAVYSPSLKKNIGTVYLPIAYKKENAPTVQIEIRGKLYPARIQKGSFISKKISINFPSKQNEKNYKKNHKEEP